LIGVDQLPINQSSLVFVCFFGKEKKILIMMLQMIQFDKT